MAKKSFKKEGGFGKGMYQSSTPETTPLKGKYEPARSKHAVKKVSAKGYVRHTLMIKPTHLEELREVSYLAKRDMMEVLAAALERYFSENWPDDRKEELRAKREKEAQEKEEIEL